MNTFFNVVFVLLSVLLVALLFGVVFYVFALFLPEEIKERKQTNKKNNE